MSDQIQSYHDLHKASIRQPWKTPLPPTASHPSSGLLYTVEQMAQAQTLRKAPAEIERLFQTSLFLLVVTGFATVASTGKLDLLSIIFVFTALGQRA